MLAAGIAATQFSGLALPNENDGLKSDVERLGKLTTKSFDYFVPIARAVIESERRAFEEVVSQCTQKYEQLRTCNVDEGKHVLLDASQLGAIFKETMSAKR